jgi:hypothetical protein
MIEQRAGGYSVIVCHYCHQPVAMVATDGTWLHLDATKLCYEVIGNE